MKFKRIRIMPDFASTGLWDQTKQPMKTCGGMIEYDELKLSRELIKEFKVWIEYYEDSFDSNYSIKPGRARWFNRIGKGLAQKVKDKFPQTIVTYWGETSQGLKKEEII
jgi:hypothetical protein